MNATIHTIQDEWLLSYAAGSLTPGRSLLVASHVSYHEQMQARVADAEQIGGALLERTEPAAVDAAVLEQLLARIDDAPAAVVEPAPATRGIFPPALVDQVGADVDALKWRWMGPGMRYLKLWNGPEDERVWLLRARGGAQMPEHGHNGDEWTLILKGSYRTEFGHYRVGDLDISDEAIVHQPVIDDGDECICLVVTHGPIRMKSLLARAAQPFIGL